MTEPAATKSIDFRHDDSKTEAEILALTDGDNKTMVASDTNAIYTIDDSGNKKQHGFVHRSTADPTVSNDDSQGFSVGDFWNNTETGNLKKCDDNSTGAAIWNIVPSGNLNDLDVIGSQDLAPVDFSAPASMEIPTVINTGKRAIIVSGGPETFRPTGKKYYVSTTGSDANDGLTALTALRSVKTAIEKPDVDEVIVEGGFYERNKSMQVSPTRDISIICPTGDAVLSQSDILSWSTDATYTNLEKAARSNCYTVVQRDRIEQTGLYSEYVLAPDLATANANPGQWYTDNVTVWVNPFAGYAVNANTLALLTVVGGLATNVSIYTEGITFVGGLHAFKISELLGTSRIRFGMRKCKNWYGQGNSVTVLGGVDSIIENSEASGAILDGFNYHYYATSGDIPTSVEVNCRGFGNGRTAPEINNGSTTHDVSHIARFGCFYYDNYGPNVHDVDNSFSWNVECQAFDSTAPTTNDDFRIEGDMWLDNCVGDIYGITSGTMYATYGTRVTVVPYTRFVRKRHL
jgi:hypothetical protein